MAQRRNMNSFFVLFWAEFSKRSRTGEDSDTLVHFSGSLREDIYYDMYIYIKALRGVGFGLQAPRGLKFRNPCWVGQVADWRLRGRAGWTAGSNSVVRGGLNQPKCRLLQVVVGLLSCLTYSFLFCNWIVCPLKTFGFLQNEHFNTKCIMSCHSKVYEQWWK